MADEGNEDSWLYGNTNADGKNGDKGDEHDGDGDDTVGKDGTSMDGTGDQSQWETEEPNNRGSKRPRSHYPDGEHHHQHDDNAMDSSDLGQSRDDSTRREDDFHGEEDSHLQEDESHDQHRTDKPDRSDGEMDTDDSDDDDDINVVIGDIKSAPTYNIIKQRGPIVPPQVAQAAPGQDKAKQPAGKFSIEEFESVGTINGVPAHEFSIDSLDEKPWRKPGADITDYFNYGFNEETWRAYCERQKRMRMHESGVGLQGLTINNPQAAQAQNNWRQGPPPPRKMNNGIDVIGGMNMHPRPDHGQDMMPRHPKENIIQVMTADRREYSRSASKFDSPMGPPPFGAPPEFYHNEPDYGDYGYEPTQESQWNQEPNWQPHGIKTLTPGPPPQMMPPGMGMPPPHMDMMPPPMQPGMMGPPGMGPHGMRGHDRERDRDRERSERERDRERSGRPRDRERERDHRREREREREREASISKPEPVEMERSRSEKPDREPEKDKRSSKAERHKDRYRERSRSREKSKARRRSRSRERSERHSSRSEKKKSHRKDKEESE